MPYNLRSGHNPSSVEYKQRRSAFRLRKAQRKIRRLKKSLAQKDASTEMNINRLKRQILHLESMIRFYQRSLSVREEQCNELEEALMEALRNRSLQYLPVAHPLEIPKSILMD